MSLAIVAGCFYILAGLAWGIMFSYDFKIDPESSWDPILTTWQEIRNRILAFTFGLLCWPLLAAIYGWIHLTDGNNIVGWGMSRMGRNR